ncbi:MAG: methionyl-tRNA formyltransferase [Candidatus Gracilibacteria bacterium]
MLKFTKIYTMKIVFFGSPEFVLPTLKALHSKPNIEILAVVTQKDKPVGRKHQLTPQPVKVLAETLGLKVIQSENSAELETELSSLEADFFVVMAYGVILSAKLLQMPKLGAINVHASLLPKYRGASPIQEALLHGDKETGITIIKMDEKLDHGDIYLIRRIKIEGSDNQDSLRHKIGSLSAEIMPLLLEDVASSKLRAIPQNHSKATFCRKIKKSDAKIDWNKSAEEICNLVRAYNPWPIAYTEISGKKLQILEAKTDTESLPTGHFSLVSKALKIGTAKGSLLPQKVCLEGKKEMNIKEFLNGYSKLFLEN